MANLNTVFIFFSVFHNFSSYYYSQYIQAHNDQPIIKIIIKRKFFVSKILVLLYIDFFCCWWDIFKLMIWNKGNLMNDFRRTHFDERKPQEKFALSLTYSKIEDV